MFHIILIRLRPCHRGGTRNFSKSLSIYDNLQTSSLQRRSLEFFQVFKPISIKVRAENFSKSLSIYDDSPLDSLGASPTSSIKEELEIFSSLRAYMGGKLGIFPSPRALRLEGKGTEFFQVPQPIWEESSEFFQVLGPLCREKLI